MSLTGPIVNPQSSMICSGSSNEILTAVRFQIHQMPIVKHCENIWGLLWGLLGLHMSGLGKCDKPFGITHHALIMDFFIDRERSSYEICILPGCAASSFMVIMCLQTLPVGHWDYLQDPNKDVIYPSSWNAVWEHKEYINKYHRTWFCKIFHICVKTQVL